MLINEFEKLSLKKFKIKSILPDSTILILGRRRSGKSFLARDIFFHHKNIPSGVIFSGTEEASPFFGDFIPDCFIHSEYDPELVDTIMNRQKRKIREAKAKGLSETGKHPSNNLVSRIVRRFMMITLVCCQVLIISVIFLMLVPKITSVWS